MTVLFMLLSINLDSLVTGFAYGVRQVRIPLFSAVVISGFSILYSALAMVAGAAIASILPPLICRLIGAVILLIIGIIVITNAIKESDVPTPPSPLSGGTLFSLVIKSLGITISIVRDPSLCDFDSSQRIDARESLYLSFALSADAIGVGLGCAMSGVIHSFIPPLIGFSQLILLYVGLASGKFMSNFLHINKRLCGIISGLLLIVLSLMRILN